MWRFALVIFLLAVAWVGSLRWHGQPQPLWTRIAPGVEFREVPVPGQPAGKIVALRVAPRRLHIATGTPREAAAWRRDSNALAAVNGGFFDTDTKSLGVRVDQGKVLSRRHGTSWDVFVVQNGRARIVAAEDFNADIATNAAVQCAPRLVRAGKPQRLKMQWARRTGLGIQANGQVIMAATDSELSLPEWAALWAAPNGLNCRDALNLDGGPSTQLSLKTAQLSREIGSGRVVPDAVLIR